MPTKKPSGSKPVTACSWFPAFIMMDCHCNSLLEKKRAPQSSTDSAVNQGVAPNKRNLIENQVEIIIFQPLSLN